MSVSGFKILAAAMLAVAIAGSGGSVASAGPRSTNYSMDYAQVAVSGGIVQSADYAAVSLVRASGPAAVVSASVDYTVEPVTGLSPSPLSSVADWMLY